MYLSYEHVNYSMGYDEPTARPKSSRPKSSRPKTASRPKTGKKYVSSHDGYSFIKITCPSLQMLEYIMTQIKWCMYCQFVPNGEYILNGR